jgi:hypothetical protein
MVVAVHAPLVLVVAVRSAKHGGAHGACEVLDMVFPIERCDVGATKGLPALEAKQVEPSEVICFAQWVLAGWLLGDGEKFGSDNLAAVLQ